MPRKIWLLWVFVLVYAPCAYAYEFFENENLLLSMGGYFRSDVITWKNVVGLDSKNKDDRTLYLGIDYNLSLKAEIKNNGPQLYLKFERNGPYDYDAPLFIHNTLTNSGGTIGKYRGSELLPQLEEFWLDTPLPDKLRLKAGLYIYEVGNGFSLNGGYENYGATFYKETDNIVWRLYYCRPDLVNKYYLGPRIPQENEQGINYEPNAANFFAADTKVTLEKNTFWPYVGVLADYTSSGKRDNLFTAPVKSDLLGTLGLAWTYKDEKFCVKTEFAHNFGEAQSADPAYKNIEHTGYLIYGGLDYYLDKLKPSVQFLLCSGNKATLDMAENKDTTYTSGKNRAFSYYSPTNRNLGDAISSTNVEMLPIVAMGGGYGLNYGVPRPKTFSSGDFEDLIMPAVGFDYDFTDKLSLGVYGYYLSAFCRPVGTLDGKGKFLSRELGYETDVFVDYKVNPHMLISLLTGYFIPGRYYKERRDDEDGSLFSPFVRGDGSADCAYQIELCVELKF